MKNKYFEKIKTIIFDKIKHTKYAKKIIKNYSKNGKFNKEEFSDDFVFGAIEILSCLITLIIAHYLLY